MPLRPLGPVSSAAVAVVAAAAAAAAASLASLAFSSASVYSLPGSGNAARNSRDFGQLTLGSQLQEAKGCVLARCPPPPATFRPACSVEGTFDMQPGLAHAQ